MGREERREGSNEKRSGEEEAAGFGSSDDKCSWLVLSRGSHSWGRAVLRSLLRSQDDEEAV